ncbi:MAG: dienelactone hydrolase family protein [Pseudolabrys sp.]
MRLATGIAFAAFTLLGIGSAVAQVANLSLNDGNVGSLGSNKPGELVLPVAATPPYAAVVVLHGCNGVSAHVRDLARRLAGWGYAALVVDSFRPRGFDNVCNRGGMLPADQRAADVFAGAAYLRGREDIDPDRIGAIGISHGGWTVLFAATARIVAKAEGPPLRAIIAYYPWCPGFAPKLVTDLQIFIGDRDDWTPSARCVDFVAKYPDTASHRPLLKVYRGAYHSFDAALPDRIYFGHHLAPDPSAAQDSLELTSKFLDARLRN